VYSWLKFRADAISEFLKELRHPRRGLFECHATPNRSTVKIQTAIDPVYELNPMKAKESLNVNPMIKANNSNTQLSQKGISSTPIDNIDDPTTSNSIPLKDNWKSRQCEALYALNLFLRTDKVQLRVYRPKEFESLNNSGDMTDSMLRSNSECEYDEPFQSISNGGNVNLDDVILRRISDRSTDSYDGTSTNIASLDIHREECDTPKGERDRSSSISLSNLNSLNTLATIRASLSPSVLPEGRTPRVSINRNLHLETCKFGHDTSAGNEDLTEEEFCNLGITFIMYIF
jgi:hypothetical protein